jgi:hypothetical protein
MKKTILSVLVALAIAPGPGFSQDPYIEDFTSPVDLTTYVMQHFDGSQDTIWELDTYQHEGPFTFGQANDRLTITSGGYWEWDRVIIVLPESLYVGAGDQISIQAQVGAASSLDSAWVSINVGSGYQSTLIIPEPTAVPVKKDAPSDITASMGYGTTITHLFIFINAGYYTGPLQGWFVEPTSPFIGALEINSITLETSAKPVAVKGPSNHNSPASYTGSSFEYKLDGASLVDFTVYDLSGAPVMQLRDNNTKSGGFNTQNLTDGVYFYTFKIDGVTSQSGKFSAVK